MPRAKLSTQDSSTKSAPKPPRAYSGYMQRATGEEPTTPKPANPRIGRPTTYHPSYCDKVIELGKLGYSPTEIACNLNTDRETMLGWADGKGSREDGPRFGTSLARAKAEEQAWWEARGRKGLEDRHFNAHLWVKIMTCRFRQDYSDRVELTGQDGGPILFQTVYEEPPKVIDAVANPKPPL